MREQTFDPRMYTIDRTGWPAGPWDAEPDRVDFEHAGLPCMLIRIPIGAWCGYAGVNRGHPLYSIPYPACALEQCKDEDGVCEHAPEIVLRVHGGITYSEACSGHICHVPKPGQPDDVWWFGFDCHHGGDLAPGSAAYFTDPKLRERNERLSCGLTYRNVDYARAQTQSLAEQLAKLESAE